MTFMNKATGPSIGLAGQMWGLSVKGSAICRAFSLLVLPAIGSWTAPQVQAQGRFEQYTEQHRSAPGQARVVAASFFGGEGIEWFSGGGFQPDGTVVAAGTAFGPTLGAGVKETVLAPDPPSTEPTPPVPGGLEWYNAQATGFVARFSADGSRLLGVSRLPWRSAGVTGATVDAQGGIYLTGAAKWESVSAWGAPAEAWDPPAEGYAGGVAEGVYLAKLAPDASRIEWVRHVTCRSPAPTVRTGADGGVLWQASDLRTVDAAGRLVRSLSVPGGYGGKTAVDPATGRFVRYGERHSPTGREPWRCPILNLHRPDGSWELELYNWGGPLVGLDRYRLVSDSAVRGAVFDRKGHLLLHAWSDGGNSVMLREPYDLSLAAPGFKGLGWSAWGAGVLSCAYVIRLDSGTWRVRNGTFLSAFLGGKNKPNSLWIDAMECAVDGAVGLGGRSAAGLIQTGNHIGGIDPAKGGIPSGRFVKVLRPDLGGILFSSAIPGSGVADLGDKRPWAMASAAVSGKTRALFFTAVSGSEEQYGVTYPTPSVGAAQPAFGGGSADAWFLLLEWDAAKEEGP